MALSTTESRWKAGGERKRMPLLSWRVDRWRFFTHLARRASICIKLIGSPYWLPLLRSKRDGDPVAAKGRRDAEDQIERAARRENVGERSAVFPLSPPHSYPFPPYRKERIADAVREAVKIFFENKDTVSG